MKKKIVIIGGGFGGLNAAKELKGLDVEITLIDKTNHHLFQPLLYQVATAALSPGDIAFPIRAILKKQNNVKVILGEVTNIEREAKKVFLQDDYYEYDYLIIAIGSRHSYFGNSEWEKNAPRLKTISDALRIRERILLSFEKAERYAERQSVDKYLTFVIVGGGPTGVELAGAIAEISKKTMLKNFRKIDPTKTRILLIEATDRILSTYDKDLSVKAKAHLEELGVSVLTNKMVNQINQESVLVDDDLIETSNIIWAAGNEVSKILKNLDTEFDKTGRVVVNEFCSLKEDDTIFVIGDAANYNYKNGSLPGIAPVALQQGKYVGKLIEQIIKGEKKLKPFNYFDKGSMATIGRAKAILQVGKFKLSGFLAWLAWSLVHIFFLITFRNKYKVMSEWIWYYISLRNGIRLITNRTKI